MAHAFDNNNASLSEGAPSPLWSRLCPGIRIGSGLARIPRVGCDKAKRGCASRVPASPGAPHETGEGGGSDPPFFGAGAPPGRGKWSTLRPTTYPAPRGGRSLHSDPCGKAEMKTWNQVILVNLALTAVGLRVWLDPWPALGEVALLDLVHATDSLLYTIFAAVYIVSARKPRNSVNLNGMCRFLSGEDSSYLVELRSY